MAGEKAENHTKAAGSRRLYSIEYDDADGTLTPLHGQSIVDLYRSFAIGGIVAYVGSGNSYLFGYPTWDELADTLLKGVIKPGDMNGNVSPSLKEAYRDVFQKKHDGTYVLGKYERLAVATEIIRTLTTQGLDQKREALQREVEEQYARTFRFNVPFKKMTAVRVAEELARKEKKFAAIASELEAICGPYQWLPIDYRSGVELVAMLRGRPLRKGAKEPMDAAQLIDSAGPSIDVLGNLRRNWRITRYATLNYDQEIERMLEHGDYPFNELTLKHGEAEHESRKVADARVRKDVDVAQCDGRSRLGERALSIDLDPANMANLVLFAMGSPAGVSQVLHLHGSIRRPEHMIVSASDYNRRYYASEAWVDMLNDGQELLYRANAIMFIGVGMSEEVLMRAFRILSQAPDRELRPVFALMESNGTAKDTAQAIMLFQQFGIRTLFYGTRLGEGSEAEVDSMHRHPLVAAAIAKTGEKDGKAVARALSPLAEELDFLGKLSEFVAARAGNGAGAFDRWSAAVDALFDRIPGCDTGNMPICNDPTNRRFDPKRLPRLMLTPWHGSIFRLICTIIRDRATSRKVLLDPASRKCLEEAIRSLETAIRTRALHDSLAFIADRSIAWKQRWQEFPTATLPKGVEANFRGAAQARRDGRCYSHNVSVMRKKSKSELGLYGNFLTDPDGTKTYRTLSERVNAAYESKRLVVIKSKAGTGKGELATHYAAEVSEGVDRIVISFGQSCSRDSSLDLIAHVLANRRRSGGSDPVEIVLSQTDLLMTRSEERPKLAEWEAFFRALAVESGVRTLVLCEFGMTCDFFSGAWKARGADVDGSLAMPRLLRHPGELVGNGEQVRIARGLLATAAECNSVWAASFLCGIQVLMSERYNEKQPVIDAFFDGVNTRLRHALNTTQDPRQRVPAIVDVALSLIENYVTTLRSSNSRRKKVLAHAILRHLFAFGSPVEKSVFEACPEFVKIAKDYRIESLSDEIDSVLAWMGDIDLVKALVQCYDGQQPRYGLHGHVRNYLSVKKGLPFSVVSGREQTALTLIPIIDEEVVPLANDDYRFIWTTVDALLAAPMAPGSTQTNAMKRDRSEVGRYAHRVRAAYMLLRGSMRIGTVLRAGRDMHPGRFSSRTPLDEYFRRLLDIRRAALECGELMQPGAKSGLIPPIYEREWVWLFNEMGVVNILQGKAHDAIAFFEQAYEFEVKRVDRGECYESLIYSSSRQPRFSMGKCRILINMAQAEIERGSFDRSKRILTSVEWDLEAMSNTFEHPVADSMAGNPPEQGAEPKRGGKSTLHREVRLIRLSAGLINARLDYLSGGAAIATDWLDKHKSDIVDEGWHGLTALYFLIQGDVELRRKRPDKARERFAIARAEAEASGRGDLIFSVMLGEAECGLEGVRFGGEMRLQQHLAKISKIKHAAQRMGMARVVATASIIRARIYLSFGEYRSARQDLLTALTISMSNGLNTKRVSALTVMAALVGLMDNEMMEQSRKIAAAAEYEAERMGYKLAAAHAKDLELVLREQGSIEEWALRLYKGPSGDDNLSQ